MHEFFAKIAGFAFSKGAAFCYAVTVGVSGQLAYNYLQPRDPAPATAAVPAPHAAPPSPAAVSAVPAPARAVAIAPALPEPPALSLPSPAALPAPALRPAALPPSRPAGEPARPQPASPEGTVSAALPPLEGSIEIAPPPSPPILSGAGPIPLLPSAAMPESEKAAAPVRPGPGSGGLY